MKMNDILLSSGEDPELKQTSRRQKECRYRVDTLNP